jgi:eukaryotic-like serine/threonine-protein kinase
VKKQLDNSVAEAVQDPTKCLRCGATTQLDEGTCINCFLRAGIEGKGEGSRETFESVLVQADVPDTQWRLGHYEILEEIGRGGMGVIYRARQQHSRRIVAVKRIFAHQVNSHDTLVRFRREAEAVTSLDHPSILPIYEVSESEEGLPFFSMKYATGGSLRTAAPALRTKPRECVQLMAKVARGIAYAHSKGVLHRDLQPGNILLDENGEPMVSDFGLAKWLDQTSDLTRTLETLGTPGYIAPEQTECRASQLTGAADTYSLGAILFYLLTGRPPFVGPNVLSVIHQTAATPAPRLRSLVPSLDRDLETIVARCLEREPETRYRTSSEFAVDLERWLEGRPIMARRVSLLVQARRWFNRNPKLAAATAAAFCSAIAATFLFFSHIVPPPQSSLSGTVRSVAVLPLKNLTGNPENEYLTDGLTESLISGLSKIEGLKVISRESAFAFKGKEVDPREVGRQLDAMTVVQGSIRQTEGGVRVSVQLVRTADGRQLWSGESFDHTLSNALTMEIELVRSVATAIRPDLREEQENQIAKRYTENSEAYQCYLKGRYFWNKRTGADLEKAISYFDRAISLDPRYAKAYSALADAYAIMSFFTKRPFNETLPRAEVAAKKALDIDSDLAEPHATLAFALFSYYLDWAGAENEFKRALERNPNYATAHHWYGEYLTGVGRRDESIREMKRALELDPTSIQIYVDVAAVLVAAHQPDNAIKYLQAALKIDRDFLEAHSVLGRAYMLERKFEQSIPEYERARNLSHDRPDVLSELGHAYALAGKRDKASSILAQLEAMPAGNNVTPYDLAKVYVGLGDKEKALTALEGAATSPSRSSYLCGLKADVLWEPLRNEPRFQKILTSIGLMP